jgi:hypothetical protein
MHISISQLSVRLFLFCLLFLATYPSFAQINFEKGYFINESNVKTECLIKNQDWAYNPSQFKYKLNEKDELKIGSLASIIEFGVYGSFKYVGVDVKIDRSPNELADLTKTKDPIWSQEKLFLKVLISGKANLYSYLGEKNSERFFYSTANKNIQQLIFKQYLESKQNERYETSTLLMGNFAFRQQLWIDVRCSQTPKSTLETINYTKKELLNYFKKYNECAGDSFVEHEKMTNKKRELFNLSLTPGINFASSNFEADDSKYIQRVDFEKQTNLRIGLEFEFILPFKKNKWSFLLEPYYKSFKDSKMVEGYDSVRINYQAIELSFGLRYYFFLNKNSKVFLNFIANPGFAMNFNSTVEYDYYYQPLEITNSFNYGVGAGFNYRRLSAELRFYSNRNLLSNLWYYSCYYKEFAFIIGYKFLKVKGK